VQVDFYHLGRTPLPRVLAQIAGRVVADGDRLLVVAADDAQAASIDEALWAGEDSFLPHGRDGGESQPVLIATDCAPANGARFVALADGAWRDEALGFARTFYLFDDATVEGARAVWRQLASAEGCTRNFWKQDEAGRWTKAA
jgi:DNA polymerase III subunit chi